MAMGVQKPVPYVANLKDLLEELGEERVKEILAEFDCAYNEDVNYFLHEKAIEFSNRGFSTTYLVFLPFRGEPAFVGYFAIATKSIDFYKLSSFNSRYKNKITTYATYDQRLKKHTLPVYLIGQLGKNYNAVDEVLSLFSGEQLLRLACDRVKFIQSLSSGRFVYLECEDTPALLKFYESNGFRVFDKRALDRDENKHFEKSYLVQLIRYL
ncbi:hypothetical protein [Aedoeadaptatus urinae]|uniref:hypothetical protein n=1 Tax=Aedoeadaptatus urinae TaxID=1871017 RepID=UPI0009FAD9E9|nr:hypothetical protein [Peptoniphilus urinae]